MKRKKLLYFIECCFFGLVFFANLCVMVDITERDMTNNPSENANNLTFTKTELAQGFMDEYEKDALYLLIPAYFGDYEVSMVKGVIYIDNQITDVKTDSRKLYEEIQALYFSKEWNGEPVTYKDYHIEIENGVLKICDTHYEEIFLHDGLSEHFIDIPLEAMKDVYTSEYVEDEGAYIITINGKYKKYKQGKLINLPGGKLDYKVPEYEHLYLVYNKNENKMYLGSFNLSSMDYKYLYVFPAFNEAKIVELRKGTVNAK